MKRIIVLIVLASAFVGCSVVQKENPLTVARYNEELADRLANLVIQNDPIIKEEGMKEFVNEAISNAKDRADDAQSVIASGMAGFLISIREDMAGFALYLNDTLYLSSDFYTVPGPNLRIFLTQVVDPRDTEFPDGTAIDLGKLKTPYGEQTYDVPAQEKPELYRTLVLWDKKLKRLYGFAQLSRRQ